MRVLNYSATYLAVFRDTELNPVINIHKVEHLGGSVG